MAQKDLEKAKKDGWIDAWFAIEAMAIDASLVESSLRQHVERLSHVDSVIVYERDFKKVEPVKAQLKNIPPGKTAHSQVVNVKLFVKDLYTLINVILVYGPSAVEILGPKEKKIELSEIQSLANVVGGIVHEFAAQGIGGIVISSAQKN